MTEYIGRFAPSPTGPLHFGSLLAAIASYLDARSHNGTWLLRMEDLDPPREPEGAAQLIEQQLQSLGLLWDGEVLYQSTRLPAYEEALAMLTDERLCYLCDCTRGQIKAMGAAYNGQCRDRLDTPASEAATRIKTEPVDIKFVDSVYGDYEQNIEKDVGDFVIKRKDGLFAYQLAVVLDDAFQAVTDVIRGFDLLDSTPRQIYLQHLLSVPTPSYTHIPIIVDDEGQKLSKQQFATAIDVDNGPALVFHCLSLLGLNPPTSLRNQDTALQLRWGVEHWDIQLVPKLAKLHL